MKDVPVNGEIWKVNLMYYVHHSPLGVCVCYVRILAQLLSLLKELCLTQLRMFSLPEENFEYTQLQH
jgi:hypothetical protein